VDLDWADGAHSTPRPAALVLLLHGLEGSAQSGYALETYRRLARYGISAVGLNFRSCSGSLNRGARLYHSGDTDDTRFVIRTLRARFPDAALGAVGFSLAAVSVPYDLAAGARHMERGLARLYVRRLLRSLQRKVRARARELGSRMDVPRALRARTFYEFDDAATAPLHGFRDADDYYAQSSSAPWVARVGVPTLLVHADDDPFLPAGAIPRAAAAANPVIRSHFTARGGHVGFVMGPPWRRGYWAEARVAAFLAGRLATVEPALPGA